MDVRLKMIPYKIDERVNVVRGVYEGNKGVIVYCASFWYHVHLDDYRLVWIHALDLKRETTQEEK